MVLAYWGIERNQADLAKQLQLITGVGTPSNRVRVLASKTLEVFYGEGQLADLQLALAAGNPPIVMVHTSQLPYWEQDTPHAVVLLGMDEGSVVINDPGRTEALISISLGDFELAWDELANLYALITLTKR
jgi:hypothetical protein